MASTTSPTTSPLTPSMTKSPAAPPPTALSQPILTTGSVPSEVSHLFRTKRVSEIRQFESRIREEADEKSDALRQLLGTRYRDLLLAADRITQMRDAASVSVRDALVSVSSISTSLRGDLSIRAGPHSVHPSDPASPTTADVDLLRRRSVHVVGSRLKHIVDSPEVLYACLESGDLYEAAARFVLAQRNYRALLDAPQEDHSVANKFADARWALVSAFRSQIVAAAERRLVATDLQVSEYAHVFAAIIVLSSNCDIVSIVESMLATRTASLSSVRERSGSATSDVMRAVATVVQSTVSCMAHLFWLDDQGVEKLVHDIDPDAANVVGTARERGGLNGAVIGWASNVRAWLHENGEALLAGATNSRQVIDTLHAVDDVFSVDGWASECNAALQRGPEFVFDIFKPFISTRAAMVAEESVVAVVRNVLAEIDTAWSGSDVDFDVGKAIWSTISSQAVGLGEGARKSGDDMNARDAEDEDKNISLMLTRTGSVSNVVQTFETHLSEALADISTLTKRVSSVSKAFDVAIRKHIPVIYDDLRKRFELIKYVDTSNEEGEDTNEKSKQNALFIARASTALVNSKSMTEAFCFVDSGAEKRAVRSAALDELRHRAAKVSSLGFSAWARILCEGFSRGLLKQLTEEKLLVVEMGWTGGLDGNNNLENGQEDESLSAIRIPSTVSTGLLSMLLSACLAVNSAGGFGLPMEAIENVQAEITKTCVNVYRAALEVYVGNSQGSSAFLDDDKENVDKAVMQMLFDVQCIRNLLDGPGFDGVSSSLKGGELKKVEGEIQAWIDPIDIASSRKSMRDSVSGYIARSSTLLGPIVRRRDGQGEWMGSARNLSGLSTSANVVRLSKTVSRFTYLPAPMPSTFTSSGVGTAGLNAKAIVGALRNETSSSAVAADRKTDTLGLDTAVAGYASKVSESVGRLGRGFFESLTRKVA